MAIEHTLFIEIGAPRAALRDAIVGAGLGFEALEDWENLSRAKTESTSVTIMDRDGRLSDPARGDLWRAWEGVPGRRSVSFRNRKGDEGVYRKAFAAEAVGAVVALLRAWPHADAYMQAYSDVPAMLRKNGRLVLSAQLADDDLWNPKYPCLALIDLPHVVEPLGTWRRWTPSNETRTRAGR